MLEVNMAYIEEYEDEDLPDVLPKGELEKKYKRLCEDMEFMLHSMKQFNAEVNNLRADMMDLKINLNSEIMHIDHYSACKNYYVDLYHKFDNIRNGYDKYVKEP
jgi:hypothetical protein